MSTEDRGPVFDGVKIGRPATGALIDAGYRTIDELPEHLDELLPLHGVGPRGIALLAEARAAGE
ncbi:helix-hairpin-helix domain-containing protein [Nocardia sp. NPDC002869]|uniref:helix-hairpin-helix domain-containing protein n=1 Tax=Nocardia sp. NPDC002869 TaxID=3161032 RepID=UPI00398C96AF